MIDLFREWPAELQFWFMVAVLVMAVILAWIVATTLRLLALDYPPVADTDLAKECNHDDNLTGRCIKRGNCRTRGECDGMVAASDIAAK